MTCVLEVRSKPVIGQQFITEDGRACFNLFADVLLKFFLSAIVNHERANIATTFNHPHNDGFVLSASAGDALLAFCLVHIAGFAADEGFVNFDFPAQLPAALLALLSKADAMEQKPSGLLGDAERPRYLATADTVLRVLKHPHCRKPFVQSDWGIFHDGPNLHGELAARVPNAALPPHLVSQGSPPWRYRIAGIQLRPSIQGGALRGSSGSLPDRRSTGWIPEGFGVRKGLPCFKSTPKPCISQVYICPKLPALQVMT
jgi:hypothetical protein